MTGASSSKAVVEIAPDTPTAEVRRLLLDEGSEAISLPSPPLDQLAYQAFIRALLDRQGFKLDLRGQSPHAVLGMVANRLLGTDPYVAERAMLADAIASLEKFAAGLIDSPAPPQTAIRTYFAPGDLVWHVDRMNEPAAFRLIWPIGRCAGMSVTPAANIDPDLYRAYTRREHPLLCKLDTRVLHAGVDVERYWSHRPVQLEAMRSGAFPFIIDPDQVVQVPPDAISVHRVETAAQPGTYHRSSWANRMSPGVQIVITVAGH